MNRHERPWRLFCLPHDCLLVEIFWLNYNISLLSLTHTQKVVLKDFTGMWWFPLLCCSDPSPSLKSIRGRCQRPLTTGRTGRRHGDGAGAAHWAEDSVATKQRGLGNEINNVVLGLVSLARGLSAAAPLRWREGRSRRHGPSVGLSGVSQPGHSSPPPQRKVGQRKPEPVYPRAGTAPVTLTPVLTS